MTNLKNIFYWIVRTVIFIVFACLTVYYLLLLMHHKTSLWNPVILLLLTLCVAYFDKLTAFTFLGLKAEFKTEIEKAHEETSHLRELRLEMYKQNVESMIDFNRLKKEAAVMSSIVFPNQLDQQISSLRNKLKPKTNDEDKYVFSSFYKYKLEEAVQKLLNQYGFWSALSSSEQWQDDVAHNPSDPIYAIKLIEFARSQSGLNQKSVEYHAKEIWQWVNKLK